MNNYSFAKGLSIIAENIAKGLFLILALVFEGGIIRYLMYFVLAAFICKGIYDLCKESTAALQAIAYLFMVFSGIVAGFSLGLIVMSMYFGLLFEFLDLLLHLIFASLLMLSLGIFSAYRLDVYKRH
jgi:hypothetical protein